MMMFTWSEQPICRALLKNIIDNLNGIDYTGLDQFDRVVRLKVVY